MRPLRISPLRVHQQWFRLRRAPPLLHVHDPSHRQAQEHFRKQGIDNFMGSSKPTPKQMALLAKARAPFEEGVKGAIRQALREGAMMALEVDLQASGEGAVKEGGEGAIRQALQEGGEGRRPAGTLGRRQGRHRTTGAPRRRRGRGPWIVKAREAARAPSVDSQAR